METKPTFFVLQMYEYINPRIVESFTLLEDADKYAEILTRNKKGNYRVAVLIAKEGEEE